jgi:hypothetical protein
MLAASAAPAGVSSSVPLKIASSSADVGRHVVLMIVTRLWNHGIYDELLGRPSQYVLPPCLL